MPATRTVVLATGTAEYAAQQLEGIPGIELVERYELASAHADGALGRELAEAGAGGRRRRRAVHAPVFEAAPGLEALLRWGTGSDAIDIAAATDAGVAVVTTPAVNAEAVADMALALMLACLRRLRSSMRPSGTANGGRRDRPAISRAPPSAWSRSARSARRSSAGPRVRLPRARGSSRTPTVEFCARVRGRARRPSRRCSRGSTC